MEWRVLAGVAAVGLFIAGFGLVIGLMLWSVRLRSEHRPPPGISGLLAVWRFDYYSAKGRSLIAKEACAMALLSFVFVSVGWLAAKFPPSERPARANTPELPPDMFFVAASGLGIAAAFLAGVVLILGAMVQFALAIWKPSNQVLRVNAGHCAVYGLAALAVAGAHILVLRLGTTLLK